jgi:HEAT repeat protein
MISRSIQTSLRRLVILVACFGVITWAYRRIEEARRPPSTLDWVRSLQTGNEEERRLAADRLASERAVDAGSVIPALAGALSDSSAAVRSGAALALGRYLSATVPLLKEQVMPETSAAARELLRVIRADPDPSVRSGAGLALGSLLTSLADARLLLDRSPSDTVIDRAEALAALDSALRLDPNSRHALIAAFLSLGPTEMAAPKSLLAALDDPSKSIRLQALRALASFGSGVDAAVPVLLRDVESEADVPERRAAGTSGTVHNYHWAAERLRPSPAVLPVLVEALDSPNRNVRAAAARILGQMGRAARPAAPALAAAARKRLPTGAEPNLRAEAHFADFAPALVRVLPPGDAVAILSEALRPDDYWTRNASASALARLGPLAHTALPALVETMKDAAARQSRGDSGYAVAVAEALGEIAPQSRLTRAQADDIVAALRMGLDFKDPLVRGESANALAKLGPRAAPALPRLNAIAKEETTFRYVRDAAARAIEHITGGKALPGKSQS